MYIYIYCIIIVLLCIEAFLELQHGIHWDPLRSTENLIHQPCDGRSILLWVARDHLLVGKASRCSSSAASELRRPRTKNMNLCKSNMRHMRISWIWSLKKHDVFAVSMSRVTSAPSSSPLLLKPQGICAVEYRGIFPSNHRGSQFQILRFLTYCPSDPLLALDLASLPHSTTVWAWLKTVVICKQPGHLGTPKSCRMWPAESSMGPWGGCHFWTSKSPRHVTFDLKHLAKMYASRNITIGTTCHIPNVSGEYLPMSSKLLHVHEEASAMSDELIGIRMAESTHTVISYSFIYIISAYVYIVVFVVELIAVLMSTRLGRRRHVVPHRNNIYTYIYIYTAPNCVWRSCLAIGSCASTCACTSPAASASKRWWYVQSVPTGTCHAEPLEGI